MKPFAALIAVAALSGCATITNPTSPTQPIDR